MYFMAALHSPVSYSDRATSGTEKLVVLCSNNGILCTVCSEYCGTSLLQNFQDMCYKHENKLNIKDHKLMCK